MLSRFLAGFAGRPARDLERSDLSNVHDVGRVVLNTEDRVLSDDSESTD